MKQKFSTQWQSSVQVRKQRKYRHNAPLHIKHKFLSAHLSADLRKKYDKRSVPLRKGDEVLIMRGTFKKKKGKITKVNVRRNRIVIENINRSKKDGSKVNVYFNPSNLVIQSLNLDDVKRLKIQRKNEKKTETKKEVKKETKEEKKQDASSKNTSN
jgi:large subunit ribosomal protein L24